MSEWDRRGNNFDFMRLSLAVLVIYSHAFILGSGTDVREPLVRYSHGQATLGAVAVDSFFVMSGFLITGSALRSRGVWSYLKKRVARIYPAFAVAALLMAVIVLPISGGHFVYPRPVMRVGMFLLQLLRLREFNYDGPFLHDPYPQVINGSTWSVSYEFWCYIGVALLMVTKTLGRRWLLLGSFVVAWMYSGWEAAGGSGGAAAALGADAAALSGGDGVLPFSRADSAAGMDCGDCGGSAGGWRGDAVWMADYVSDRGDVSAVLVCVYAVGEAASVWTVWGFFLWDLFVCVSD
jgi:peptidoglycan/LPS O-acetylase OafA/YrhL